MSYLIDTQVLIWLEESPEKISKNASNIIYSSEPIFVSMVSIWEIVIKRSLNKLSISKPTDLFISDFLKDYTSSLIAIEIKDILSVEYLPNVHRDPFDRIIVSQSINRNLPVISSDKIFDLYPIKRIW